MKRMSIANVSWVYALLMLACTNDFIFEETSTQNENSAHSLTSTTITIEEAESDLKTLLGLFNEPQSRINTTAERRIKNSYVLPISNAKGRSEQSDEVNVYVFNFEDNNGYAIMSGDKRMPSLLALSNSGTLEDGQDSDNPGVRMFFDGLNGLIPEDDSDLKILLPGGTDSIIPRPSHWEYGEWKNIVYHQGGLCPVKWGQGFPYNEYCPIIDTSHALAGCVAVATAQLMAVHKFPESYNGYNYNWDLMISSTYQYYWSDASEQIARLLQQLGLRENLNIKYGLNESSAYSSRVPPTLKSFGYSSAEVINYNTYQVIPELKNGYPILVCGVSAGSGHMWLIHGLLERTREVKEYLSNGKLNRTYNETHWYVQCNWGWNGYDDGYYLSTVFNTNDGYTYPDWEASSRADATGNGYNFDQDIIAIINIRK